MAEIGHERANSLGLRTADCDPISSRESNIIFVDGLPTDCTRREVGRILLPHVLTFVTISPVSPTLFTPCALTFLGCRQHPKQVELLLKLKTTIVVFLMSL